MAAEPRSPTRDIYTNRAGESFSILRFPFVEGRTTLHWAHATGFHSQAYQPLLELLASYFNVCAWDMRGHGASQAPADPAQLDDWQVFYGDLAAYVSTLPDPLVLAGHSVGAVCSLAAAARLGGRVSALVLVDPILMTGVAARGFGLMKRLGLGSRHPLVAGALRRRPVFPSRQEAGSHYRDKPAFRNWAAGFLESYVAGGFRASEGGVTLCCAPAWEARQFATTEHDAWPWLAGLRCPVLLLRAQQGSTVLPGAAERFGRCHPATRDRQVAGTSHFLPMEAPDVVQEEILDFLDR